MKTLIDSREPIGAVVKKIDLVNTNILRRTSKYGTFNRIEWQFLNFMKKKANAPIDEIFEFLNFFGNRQVIQELIDRFKWDGLIAEEKGIMSITSRGETAYEEVYNVQEEIKAKAMIGVTAQDYDTTIDTLYKIMDNVKEFLPREEEQNENEDNTYPESKLVEHSKDVEMIKALIASIEKTFNEKDPDKFAALFDHDAAFVNAMGTRLKGRDQIHALAKKMMQSTLNKSFAKYEVTGIKFIKKDVALVEVIQKPIDSNGTLLEEEAEGIPTYILIKDADAGQWKILAGQNTIVHRGDNDKK